MVSQEQERKEGDFFTRYSVDPYLEERILGALIVSDEFCSRVFTELDIKNQYWEAGKNVRIFELCRQYWKETGRALKLTVEDAFEKDIKISDPEWKKETGRVLRGIVSKYGDLGGDDPDPEKWDSNVLFEDARLFCSQRNMEIRMDKASKLLNKKKVEEAEEVLQGQGEIKLMKSRITLLSDEEEIAKADERAKKRKLNYEGLFSFPKELGPVSDIIGYFDRKWLVAYLASTGVGKSWWLETTAVHAFLSGCNVLFVTCEMSKEDQADRFYMELTGRAMFAGPIVLPVFDCRKNQLNKCRKPERLFIRNYRDITDTELSEAAQELNKPTNAESRIQLPIYNNRDDEDGFRTYAKEYLETDPLLNVMGKDQPRGNPYIPCTYCRGDRQGNHINVDFEPTVWGRLMDNAKELSGKSIISKVKSSAKMRKRARGLGITRRLDHIAVVDFIPDFETVDGIFAVINAFERQEKIQFDVVVIDYADRIAPPDQQRFFSERGPHKAIWAKLEAYSKQKNICLVTASQTNRPAKDKKDIEQNDVSEDWRKVQLAQKLILLHQTDDEAANYTVRVSSSKERFMGTARKKQAIVLENFAIGQIVIDSEYEARTWKRLFKSITRKNRKEE